MAAIGRLDRLMAWPFRLPIALYRLLLSPFLGGRCRFYPSCSVYAGESYKRHGAVWGTLFSARRLSRCHPFHPGGIDPVPETRGRNLR